MRRMMTALGSQPTDVGGPVAVLMGLGLPETDHVDLARDWAAKASRSTEMALQAAHAGDCSSSLHMLRMASLALGAAESHVLSAGREGGAIGKSAKDEYAQVHSEVVRRCFGQQAVRSLLRPAVIGGPPEARGGSPVARHIAHQWQVLEQSAGAASSALDNHACSVAEDSLIRAGQAADSLRYAAREAAGQPPEMRAVMPTQEEYQAARRTLDALESRFLKVCLAQKPKPTPLRR